jgi:O-antigen ligase
MPMKISEAYPTSGFWATSCLTAAAAVLAAIFVSNPILVPIVVQVVIACLFFYAPTTAIKLLLLSAGLPLSLFYEEVGYFGGGVKPLFSEWGGTTPDGLQLILSCILLCIVLFKLQQTRSLLLRFWPYAAMLLFLAGTIVRSTAPVEGFRLLLKMAFPFLLFLTVAQFVRSSEDVEVYGRYWIAGGVIASICAPVLVLITGTKFLFPADEFRLSPGFTSASSFSFYTLALFLYCYAQWRKRRSLTFAGLAVLFGIETGLSLTRIAWAAMFVGLVVFELFYGKGKKKWLVAASIGLLPTLCLYLVIWTVPALQHRVFQSDEIDSDLPALEQAQSIGLTGRGTVWLAGLEDYQEHSLLWGQGIGSSDRYFMTLFGTVAHNEYLRVLYDGGAIGLLLFLFANIWMLYRLVRSRPGEDSTVRMFTALSVALMVAYLVTAVTDNPLDYYLLFTQYVFFVLGVCSALRHRNAC